MDHSIHFVVFFSVVDVAEYCGMNDLSNLMVVISVA
jgi:hypothetical protein